VEPVKICQVPHLGQDTSVRFYATGSGVCIRLPDGRVFESDGLCLSWTDPLLGERNTAISVVPMGITARIQAGIKVIDRITLKPEKRHFEVASNIMSLLVCEESLMMFRRAAQAPIKGACPDFEVAEFAHAAFELRVAIECFCLF